ncbi:hypothetical protein [Streptomyces sp. NPDC058613]|uniref:hypothetical protein n=1 Tax=unclassified Streptomyces TaxID=2593676 RepID=UPI00365CEF07
MNKKWIAAAELAAGLVLLALFLFEVVGVVPYSIFVVLAGGGLLVAGARRAGLTRRRNRTS